MPTKNKAKSKSVHDAAVTPLETKFDRKLRKDIVQILKDYGESFIDDTGVLTDTCTRVSRLIMQRLKRDPIQCLVSVTGGVVQGALADLPNIEIDVHDYDVFEGEPWDAHNRTKAQAEHFWEKSRRSMHPVL